MNIKLEYFNMATGFLLFAAGLLYFVVADITSALSWSIFGAMYLVMDSYKPCPVHQRTTSHLMREIFGLIGFVLSLALFVYVTYDLFI